MYKKTCFFDKNYKDLLLWTQKRKFGLLKQLGFIKTKKKKEKISIFLKQFFNKYVNISMQLSEYEVAEFKVLKIIGDLDASSSIYLDEAFKTLLQNKPKAILIDCTHLQYIASAGLGVFISYIDILEEENIYFALFSMNEKVKNVFQLLGLEKLLIITNTIEEAKLKIKN